MQIAPEETAPESELLPRRLSTDLRALLLVADGKGLTIQRIEQILQGRGFAMLIILLAAPSLVPTPGLSTPFGLAISLLGLRIATGRKPALPGFILRREVSYKVLERLITRLAGWTEKIERGIKPRMFFLQEHPWMINLIGAGIVSGGVVLALPLLVPFSNALPAISIMLLAAGMMERDGLLVLYGYVVGLGSWIYLAFWWQALVAAWKHFF